VILHENQHSLPGCAITKNFRQNEKISADCLQTRAAWQEIVSDEDDVLTELDLSDDHKSGQVRLLVYHQAEDPPLKVYDGSDTGVTVDFTKSHIELSKVLLLSSLFIVK